MPLLTFSATELEYASKQVRALNRTIRSDINKATVAMLNPVWRAAVAAEVTSSLDRAALAVGARVKGGAPPVAVAASGKPLRGGLNPKDQWPVVEFGAIARNKTTTYTAHSPKGTSYQVTRHTARQLPARNKSGRVVYAALAKVAPRVVSLWVQMLMKDYAEALGVSK